MIIEDSRAPAGMMKTEITPTWIVAGGFGALAVYLCLGLFLAPLSPMTTDAENFSHWTSADFAYASSPIDVSVISPVQGLGGLVQPLGVWINPAHLAAHFLPARDPRAWSFLVVSLLLAAATFLLARAVELPCHLAVAAAQLIAIVCFPPAVYRLAGITHLNLVSLYVNCSPPIAFVTALGTSLLAVFLYLGRLSVAKNVACAALVPVLVVYAVFCDPLYTPMFLIPIAVFLAGTFTGSGSKPVFLWRTGGAAACLVVCLALNLQGFYHALTGYAARAVFPNELYVEIQRWDYLTNLIFQGGLATVAGVLVIFSCILACVFGTTQVRGLALSILGFQLLLIGISLVYVYSGVRWSMPLPVYFEYSALPADVVMIFLGLRIGYQRLRAQRGAPRPVFVYCAVLVLPAAAMIAAAARSARASQPAPSASDAAHASGIAGILKQELALADDGLFRGSVASIIGVPGGGLTDRQGIPGGAPYTKDDLNTGIEYLRYHVPDLFTTSLWNLRIPTLEDNNHLVTPPFHFLVSRALSRPQDFHSRNWAVVTKAAPRLMAALGARFLVSDAPQPDPLLTLRTQANEDGIRLYLYGIPDANMGGYSPVQTVNSASATETIARMTDGRFDFRDIAIIHEGTLPALTRADLGAMYFEKGGVRIRGKSRALSLLVLPMQFSNSLCVTSIIANSKGAPIRLLRVNLLETGVLFDGEIELKIAHVFGPLRGVAGRLQDIEDCRRLGIRETGEIPYPPNYQPLAGKWLRRSP